VAWLALAWAVENLERELRVKRELSKNLGKNLGSPKKSVLLLLA